MAWFATINFSVCGNVLIADHFNKNRNIDTGHGPIS